jgi:uncharacterized DUF497 family protein
MDFEWDPEKRESNLRKHSVDFVDAARLLTRPHLTRPSHRIEDREPRWQAIGPLLPPEARPEDWSGPLAVVVYTKRSDRYRIIFARRASSDERQHYKDQLGGTGSG